MIKVLIGFVVYGCLVGCMLCVFNNGKDSDEQ